MALFSCTFYSYSLSGNADLDITIPSLTYSDCAEKDSCSHKAAQSYPVLYLLHGYSNNSKSWIYYSSICRYAEERQLALVIPSVGNTAYMNSSCGAKYYDFISQELPEFIKAYFPVSGRREDTYIGGISMGGYGALVHALSHPEKYAAVGALSPAIKIDTIGIPHEFPPLTDLYGLLNECEAIPPVYMCLGENDFMHDDIWDFHKALSKKKSMQYTFEELPGYEHSWDFWDMQLPKFLDWLPRSDVYAEQPRRQV